jgi:hypothetical protein
MSFLEKIKTQAAPVTPAAPAKKPNPFAKKEVVAPPIEESVKEVEKSVEVKEEAKDEPKAAVEVKKPNPFAPNKDKVVAPAPVTAAPVEEVKEEEKAPAAPVTPAPAPKTSNRGKKGAGNKKVEEKVDVDADDATEVTSFPTTLMSYDDAIAAIKSPFVDDKWVKKQDEVHKKLDAVKIEQDMNDAVLKSVVGELNNLRSQIWREYNDAKTLFEQLSGKEPEGLIERIKKTSLGDGTNDLQRKKAGVEACMIYTGPNATEPVNLYEVLDEVRSRYNFYKGIMDSISFKANILITMSSAIKREQQLAPGVQV